MKKTGIIGAMDLEVDALKANMTDVTVTTKAGMDFYEGKLAGAQVVVVRCGIGKINAAICTQILADQFHVTGLINTGIAGALNAQLRIGDLLISDDALHHDFDLTIFGYVPGQVPGFDREFKADRSMADLAIELGTQLDPDCRCIRGRVVSGDQFISDGQIKARLISEFGGDCAEMEGASIAHTATCNGIPFVIIRAISDQADGAAEMDYPTFEKLAAARSAKLVEAMAARLR